MLGILSGIVIKFFLVKYLGLADNLYLEIPICLENCSDLTIE